MSIKALLPEPSLAYNVDRERIRNATILRLLSGKLNKDKLPEYPGIPMVIAKGTSTAFSVLTGVSWTNLPFTTASLFNEFLGSFSGGIVTVSKSATLQHVIYLAHTANVGAGNVLCEIGIFINGSLFKSLFQSIPYDKDCGIMLIDYLSSVNTGDDIELKIRHDNAGTLTINMIQSSWALTQLSPDPIYVESRL